MPGRRPDAQCVRGGVHLSQEADDAVAQGNHREDEESAHQPSQAGSHERVDEQRCDEGANQQRREGGERALNLSAGVSKLNVFRGCDQMFAFER